MPDKTGILAHIDSHPPINRRPKYPVVKAPNKINTTTTITTPNPGIAKGKNFSGLYSAGNKRLT